MKTLILVLLSTCAAVCGLVAAIFWHRASPESRGNRLAALWAAASAVFTLAAATSPFWASEPNVPHRLEFSEGTAQELTSRLPPDRGIDLKTVGSNKDQQVADQYRAYLVAHGYRIQHHMIIGIMAPPPESKFSIETEGDLTSLIIAPSAQ